MTPTCACGGPLAPAEGITGYYPNVPHKCASCGCVEYVPSLAEKDKRNLEALYPPTTDLREQVRDLQRTVAELARRIERLDVTP